MASRKCDRSPKSILATNQGTLWLEIEENIEALAGRDPDSILDDIVSFAKKAKIGKYDGKSRGSGAFDVSFKVKNREAGAVVLRALMKEKYPNFVFSLSDEYECKFHREAETESIIQRIERLEMNAHYIASALASIREELQSSAIGEESSSQKS